MIRGGTAILSVADTGRAVRFYVETLGMKLSSESSTASVIDAGDGFAIELRHESSGTHLPSTVRLFVKVPLEEAIAIYENRGINFDIERAGERALSARFRDLDANVLVLTPSTAATAATAATE